MNAENSGQQFHAVIIGSSADEFVCHAVKIIYGLEIDYLLCEDIYSVAAQLAKNAWRNPLVIGRFENLNKEEGWIFQKSGQGRFSCCCFIGSSLDANRRKIANLKKASICIINDMEDFEAAVTKILWDNSARVARITKAAAAFNKEDFVVAKEEMDALFED